MGYETIFKKMLSLKEACGDVKSTYFLIKINKKKKITIRSMFIGGKFTDDLVEVDMDSKFKKKGNKLELDKDISSDFNYIG